jgi:Protein of unknown function (DUF3140)
MFGFTRLPRDGWRRLRRVVRYAEVIQLSQTDPELASLWGEFHALVNMPSPDLRAWLGTAPRDQEGYLWEPDVDIHELGTQVLRVLDKRRVDLTAEDIATMRRAVELSTGWLASPREDDDRWRHSLMTLGHDPLKPNSVRGPDVVPIANTREGI